MDTELYAVVTRLVFSFVAIVTDYYLFRKWFKYNATLTMCVYVLGEVLVYFVFPALDLFTGSAAVWIRLITVVIYLFFIKRKKLVDLMIIYDIYAFIYNITGMIYMVVFFTLYQYIVNGDTHIWFLDSVSDASECIIRVTGAFITSYLCYHMVKKIVPVIEGIEGKWKSFLFFSLVIPIQGYFFIRYFLVQSNEDMLGGSAVIWYAVMLATASISMLIMLMSKFLEAQYESKNLRQVINMQLQYYHKVMSVQEKLQEIKHDLSNSLIVQGANYNERIIKYCKTIMRELEELENEIRRI